MISRIAPTPNGEIHWGNLMNFALTWAETKKRHGQLWLRFDDIDQARCKEEYAQGTRELLNLLGIDWQYELSNQTARLDVYRNYLKQVPHYVCECSRKDVEERTGGHLYDGHCRKRNLAFKAGESSLRFLSHQTPANDYVIWRKEDLPAYHLTSICDDEELKISLIVRGIDLLESTEVQREISNSLNLNPLKNVEFIHHKLLTDENGEKLSKSRMDGELFTLVKKGANAQEIWQELGRLMQAPAISSADDFLKLDLDQYRA